MRLFHLPAMTITEEIASSLLALIKKTKFSKLAMTIGEKIASSLHLIPKFDKQNTFLLGSLH
jgi:hypothetical protein